MRNLAIAVTIALLLPVSAHAQVALGSSGSGKGGPLTARTDAEKKTDEAVDKAYQDQLKNPQFSKQTDSKNNDPWGAIRPASNAKP
jgi:hypothetical protein